MINRADQERTIDIDVVYASDLSLQEAGVIVEDAVDEADLASDTEFIVGGDQELLDDVIADIVLAFMLGLAFIYLVMVAQFESFKYPLIVMFTVPLFIIGVMLSLTVTQNPLSVMVFIGIIVLAGIVVNNAIVLVDYINQQKEKGIPTADSIVRGVQDRSRPILITALTTIFGVVPLALGFGEGTELIQPMGIVIIGGLISSTLLTLFVIPVLYSFFDKTTRNMNKKYVTPDGEVVYQRDLDQRRAEEPPADSDEPFEVEAYMLPAFEEDEPEEGALLEAERTEVRETPQTKDTEDSGSSDELVKEMEKLVEKLKKDRRDGK
jgi:hydrophobic/amphiphilic exporter-1 (mainly G- bacteria), HAE1 family